MHKSLTFCNTVASSQHCFRICGEMSGLILWYVADHTTTLDGPDVAWRPDTVHHCSGFYPNSHLMAG